MPRNVNPGYTLQQGEHECEDCGGVIGPLEGLSQCDRCRGHYCEDCAKRFKGGWCTDCVTHLAVKVGTMFSQVLVCDALESQGNLICFDGTPQEFVVEVMRATEVVEQKVKEFREQFAALCKKYDLEESKPAGAVSAG